MLSEYKRKTNIGVGVGLFVQVIGRYLDLRGSPNEALAGLLIFLAGLGVFIWGCAQYAKGKGHSGLLGVLGLLSILGLIVLVFLPDRHKLASA